MGIRQSLRRERERRGQGGFTMTEMLLVVAIIVIMGGLLGVSVLQWQKNLYQIEMDGTAKELYVAAQNHLTTAKAQGVLDVVDNGTAVAADASGASAGSAAAAETDTYYYVVNPSNAGAYYRAGTNVLAQMLPFGSIDETVRAGGSYVIAYQVNSQVARVLDVFYANPGGQFPVTFSDVDYTALKNAYSGTDKSAARRSYDGGNGIIGWYGGDAAGALDLPVGELNAPRLEVENAERLRVRITDANMSDNSKANLKADLRLFVEGVTSGAVAALQLASDGAYVPGVAVADEAGALYYNNATYVCTIDLDDITTSGHRVTGAESGHVADLPAGIFDATDPTKPTSFIPGEDLTIYAVASTDDAIAADVRSAAVTENSLFDSLAEESTDAGEDPEAQVAVVSSIRHLENLGQAVSGYSAKELTGKLESAAAAEELEEAGQGALAGQALTPAQLATAATSTSDVLPITGAVQAADLSWNNFRYALLDDNFDEATGQLSTATGAAVQVSELSAEAIAARCGQADAQAVTVVGAAAADAGGTSVQLAAAGTYAPVVEAQAQAAAAGGSADADFAFNYDGTTLRVSDIVVLTADASGNAGLFGRLEGGSVADVELVNFSVAPQATPASLGSASASAGAALADSNAGALAGSAVGCAVTGVLARNEPYSDGATDAAYEVTGGACAGGLVGAMQGGSIAQSAAALYVRATDDDGAAGGLVGAASATAAGTGAAAPSIQLSYSGGHTVNGGTYLSATLADGTAVASDAAGRLNVQAAGAAGVAGGLVGTASGAAIASSYSTCSAYAQTAGGLVGGAEGGSIANSYATGLAVPASSETGIAGAFIGTLASTTLEAGANWYLDYLDDDNFGEARPAIGNSPASTAVSQIDDSLSTYGAFATGEDAASPYDSALTTRFSGMYPLKNIPNLSGASAQEAESMPVHLVTHYGDWPSPGALVVND